ncbi:CRISPR-associated endonuclease Cas2 [Lachnobacterium bovis]|uniref:CRISPR-associated endoribonuclease Cas2 n=1 Tax=Lachnobacterium bovis TaxID=140626 RepID=A0A1H9S057_9FIRM|nr:CRISPR-associated endonuclease Cas2 [Lachnobacterium bovis]SER78324.1 CRISPR-associated protein Cas2 [Lachnobacterium bovis]
MEDYFFQVEKSEDKNLLLILIIYDVVNDKRRNKLAKYLSGYGNRVQKSAFEAKITTKKYEKLLKDLPNFCNITEDSIRVYKIIGKSQVKAWGVSEEAKVEDVIIL